MLDSFLKGYRAYYLTNSNKLWYLLKKIPFIKNKNDMTESNRRRLGIFAFIISLAVELIKKSLFVAVFFYIPTMAFSQLMPVGSAGFELQNCFVYYGIILCCFCGSIMNSSIFNVNENSYFMLRELKINPVTYFRCILLKKSVFELISFTFAFSIFGLNVIKSFYLSIVIMCARYIGEAINIIIYRSIHKAFSNFKGGNIAIMLAGLFLAYFLPYVRGCVPDAYNIVFDTLWLFVLLVVAAFFIYYVWNYDGYNVIAYKVHTRNELSEEYDESFSDEAYEKEVKPSKTKSSGYEYLNRIFFERNLNTIKLNIFIRVLLILVAVAVASFAVYIGKGDIVYKVISYSMPVLVFVMFCMSGGLRMNKAFFEQCDVSLMRNRYYRDRNTIIEVFLIRLRYTIIIDLIPATFLSVAFALAGYMADKEDSIQTIIYVCVGIILLSILFSIYNLTMYYMLQPYNKKGELKNPLYIIVYIAVFAASYSCLYIETSTRLFTLVVGAAVAVMLMLSVTLVMNLSHRTFRIR